MATNYYERHYSGLSSDGVSPAIWSLDFAARVHLKKVVLAQTSGNPKNGATLELFNSEAFTTAGSNLERIYLVCPALTASNTSSIVSFYLDYGPLFVSMDQVSASNKSRRIYARLSFTTDNNPATWSLALAGVIEVGS